MNTLKTERGRDQSERCILSSMNISSERNRGCFRATSSHVHHSHPSHLSGSMFWGSTPAGTVPRIKITTLWWRAGAQGIDGGEGQPVSEGTGREGRRMGEQCPPRTLDGGPSQGGEGGAH